jgi:hypothetical protein
MYAAQEIPQIDTEIAQKGHFRMETSLVFVRNYGLAKLIDEIADDEQLSVHEAESLYRSLKQNVESGKIISGIKNV